MAKKMWRDVPGQLDLYTLLEQQKQDIPQLRPKLKPPISYVGGKSKQWPKIKSYIDKLNNVANFVDVFGGGGSVFINMINDYYANKKTFYYNDLDNKNYNLFLDLIKGDFNVDLLKSKSFGVLEKIEDFKNWYEENKNNLTIAENFYIKNRLLFNGRPWGDFSQARYQQNFKSNRIELLKDFKYFKHKPNVIVSNFDYKEFLERLTDFSNDEETFLYLDPPYTYATRKHYDISKMDFIEFRDTLNKYKNNFKMLISIDNADFIKELFCDWNIVEDAWVYGASRVVKRLGQELWISNF